MGTRKHTICVKHFPFTTFFLPSVTSHLAVSRHKLGTPPIQDRAAHIKYARFKIHNTITLLPRHQLNTRFALMKPNIHAKS